MEDNQINETFDIHPKDLEEPVECLKVSADSPDIDPEERKKNVKKLAGAISHSLRQSGEISVRAFGNSAIGKAAKALAIANEFIFQTNTMHLSFAPGYIKADIDGNMLTGIRFVTFVNDIPGSSKLHDDAVLMVKSDPRDIDPEERRIRVRKLAGAITHTLEEHKLCAVRCFGNASIGKASKALAIARGFTATRSIDMYCWSEFIVAKMDGSERTGICFYAYTND